MAFIFTHVAAPPYRLSFLQVFFHRHHPYFCLSVIPAHKIYLLFLLFQTRSYILCFLFKNITKDGENHRLTPSSFSYIHSLFPPETKASERQNPYTFYKNLTFNYELTVTINNIISSRAVTDHCKRISDLFFDKLYIITAIFRKIFVFSDSSDIFFPTRKCFKNRFCFSRRCVTGNLSLPLRQFHNLHIPEFHPSIQEHPKP